MRCRVTILARPNDQRLAPRVRSALNPVPVQRTRAVRREPLYGCAGGCVPKSTFGTFLASSGASKYFCGSKPTARA